MTEQFAYGARVEIEDDGRYQLATVDMPMTRGTFFGTDSDEAGYVIRYDNGCEVWKHERQVSAWRPTPEIVRAAAALKQDYEERDYGSPLGGCIFTDEQFAEIARIVLAAVESDDAEAVSA